MKTSSFTEAQILGILKQAAGGILVPELCLQHGMSDVFFINGAPNMVAWMGNPPFFKGVFQ